MNGINGLTLEPLYSWTNSHSFISVRDVPKSTPDLNLTLLSLHVEPDAQVALWVHQPAVTGCSHIKYQPALLPGWHWLHIQQHQIWLPETGVIRDICYCTSNHSHSYRVKHMSATPHTWLYNQPLTLTQYKYRCLRWVADLIWEKNNLLKKKKLKICYLQEYVYIHEH